MKVKYKLEVNIELIHKQSGNIIPLVQIVEQELDENSEKYKEICEELETEIGFKRSENKDKFDEEVLKHLINISVEEFKSKTQNIYEIFKKCFMGTHTGFVEVTGMLLNPQDFSGIRINNIKTNIYKG